jgi:hypothetical protein
LNPVKTIFVEFWSTQASFANNIKAGTPLNNYEGPDIIQDSLVFMSPPREGREEMNTEERINSYRRALLSHARIVPAEDIKTLCYEHFGSVLETVEVKKGNMKSTKVNQDFERSIDIHIQQRKIELRKRRAQILTRRSSGETERTISECLTLALFREWRSLVS